MSISVPIKNICSYQIPTIEKKLTVSKQEQRDKSNAKNKYKFFREELCFIRKKDEDHVLFPFSWAVQYFGTQYRPLRSHCRSMISKFKGSLRTEQIQIQKECIEHLNQSSSCIIAVYPGGGKCLAKGERVLLWNGTHKKVEQLKRTDILMGDDFLPRRISSLTTGRETLYRLSHKNMSSCTVFQYTVNESHILTLYHKTTHQTVDVPLSTLLRQPTIINDYLGIYMDVDAFPHFNLDKRRKSICLWIQKNGNLISQKDTILLSICMKCGLQLKPYTQNLCQINDPYNVLTDTTNPIKRVFHLYPIQIECIERMGQYYGFELSGNGRFLLHQGICTHNTITSLSIASHIGLSTLIYVNKLVLMDQWIESIQKVYGTNTTYHRIETKSAVPSHCDFYIMNAMNAGKFDLSSLQIGFVIIDECHLIVTKTLSNALFSIQPRYLLGLSATPYRPDGFNILLDLFFGSYQVLRPLYREHKVFMIPTRIKIKIQKDEKGNLIWNSVIHQQCHDPIKNQLIYNICQQHPDRNILILTKRIEQMNLLQQLFSEDIKRDLCLMKGDTFDPSARILIATIQKVGVGFSHDKLDMLILACDTEEYFIQYLGRVFRRPDVVPIIYDLVDDHPILKRHYEKRKKVYLSCGGSILTKSPDNNN